MQFSFTIAIGLLGVCLASAAPKSNKAKSAAAAQLAAVQDAKIQAFLSKYNTNAAQAGTVAKITPEQKAALKAKQQAKVQQIANKKAAKTAAKKQAKAAAKAALAKKANAAAPANADAAAGQVQVINQAAQADPLEIYSSSSSFSFKHSRRHATRFSHSESEHFKDNETWSSCSSSHSSSSCHHKKHPRYAYRLRHNRVRVERLRQNERSVSGSDSQSGDIIVIEGSASSSFSAGHHFKKTAVLRICEDELARRDNKTCNRGRRRGSSSSSSYERIDFRKKVCYQSDTETETSFSHSSSLSIAIPI